MEQPATTRPRNRSTPFLRKPLRVILEKEGHPPSITANGSGFNKSTNADVEGIENSPRNGVELGALSFDYDGDNGTSVAQAPPSLPPPQHRVRDPPPPRHLTLFDLVSIGVGGTIGSGIFVLNGLIAHRYAGPATFLSWLTAGLAALLSGCCYAELSGRIPGSGGAYAYAFVALGELPAFVTAGMLTLEFLVSGSAVARSWGDKIVEWLRVQLGVGENVLRLLEPGYSINPAACVISIATTALVVCGVKESKVVTDIFTWLKVGLVIFMIVGGFCLFDGANFAPLVPPEFGVAGVLRGAVSSFFGYLGFDAVAVCSGEAMRAERNVPLSIIITLSVVTFLYMMAAVALVGMQNYKDIDISSGFPMAFQANGIEWASQLTAFGEVFTLPVVVLISLVIQPRLQYALANDGLLPRMFGELDATGNPRQGALFAGVFMVMLATFVPFSYLDDFISAGILIAFTVTNCSLIIMRIESPSSDPKLLLKLLAWFNFLSFVTCLILSHGTQSSLGWVFASIVGCAALLVVTQISCRCQQSGTFGGSTGNVSQLYGNTHYFRAPLVPYLPCLGMFANYFLISQLSLWGIGLLVVYTLCAVVIYFLYGARNSIGRTEGWEHDHHPLMEADDSTHLPGNDAVIT